MAMNVAGTLKWILGIVLGIMLTGAVALGGWNLKKTAEVPETYATKAELRDLHEEVEGDRKELKKDVEKGFERMETQQQAIQESVNKIVDHLMNK